MKQYENLPKEGASIMLERILERMNSGCSLNDAEAQFLMAAYKTQSVEERSLAEQSNKLDKVESSELKKVIKVLRDDSEPTK